jgi:hypothetical protein
VGWYTPAPAREDVDGAATDEARTRPTVGAISRLCIVGAEFQADIATRTNEINLSHVGADLWGRQVGEVRGVALGRGWIGLPG